MKKKDNPADDASPAELRRIEEAKDLLRRSGFIERPDGTWVEPPKN